MSVLASWVMIWVISQIARSAVLGWRAWNWRYSEQNVKKVLRPKVKCRYCFKLVQESGQYSRADVLFLLLLYMICKKLINTEGKKAESWSYSFLYTTYTICAPTKLSINTTLFNTAKKRMTWTSIKLFPLFLLQSSWANTELGY